VAQQGRFVVDECMTESPTEKAALVELKAAKALDTIHLAQA
jgi:hypothetical protein